MEKLTFNGMTYYFKVENSDNVQTTKFYSLKKVIEKKFVIFGKEQQKEKYEFLFEIRGFNLKSCYSSKEMVRSILERHGETFKRAMEIEKGEFI